MNVAGISERTVYDVKCSCGRTTVETTRLKAELWKDAHLGRHIASTSVGMTLKGKVFDTNGPNSMFYGTSTKAMEAAVEEGYAFFTWNGRVFTANKAMAEMCLARDVEGLSE